MAGADLTSYAVPAWGAGELWLREALVLAHEFTFDALADSYRGMHSHTAVPSRAGPPEGAASPPTGTLRAAGARMGNSFVSIPHQSADGLAGTVEAASAAGDAAELVERFTAFLAGEPVEFADVEIDLAWTTPFQRAVARTLRAVPRGEVVTYGELAALAGYPGAARAAGTFCATNRFAFLVPCHRVVAADGIGGYGFDGVGIKRRLLALEGVEL